MKIGFIGYGKMASAIISGLIETDLYQESDIYIANRTIIKIEHLAKQGFNICQDNQSLIAKSDIIFLCTKPDVYSELLEELQFDNKLVISIAAGITSKLFTKHSIKHVLIMPNTPVMVKMGYTAIVNNDLSEKENELIFDIFTAIGVVDYITEDDLPTQIALTGSSPAYFYQIIDSMSKYFEQYDKREIELILAYIMKSSAEMILTQDKYAAQLVDDVCSKGGTTQEAIKSLKESAIDLIFHQAIDSCVKKANELIE